MPDILVRGLDRQTVKRLKERAARNHRSLQGELLAILDDAGHRLLTLDDIAEEAGFSKGAVYSRFASKADLFLALLEERIEERAGQHVAVLEDAGNAERGLVALLERAARADRAEPEWQLLVIEFRVHAARDPELNRRYAAAHERTVEALAAVIAAVCERAGEEPLLPPRRLAEAALAFGAGAALEQAANPEALQGHSLGEVAARLFTRSGAAARRDPTHPEEGP